MGGTSTKKSLFEVIGTLKEKWGDVEKIVTGIVAKLPDVGSDDLKKWNGAYIIRKNCDQWKNTFKKLENASIKKCDPAIKKLLDTLIKKDVNIDFVGTLTVEGRNDKGNNSKKITGTPMEILSMLQKDTQSKSTMTKEGKGSATTKHPAHYVLPMLEAMEKEAKNYVKTALNEVEGLKGSETELQDCLLSIKYLRKLLAV